MTTTSIPRATKALALTVAAGAIACLVSSGLGGVAQTAEAAPSSHVSSSSGATMTSVSLLQFEDLKSAGIVADSANLNTRGDSPLGDAGRFDEGCLWEKSMRNITSAKDYPAKGTAKMYADGAWTSSTDKDVWLNESIAEGRTTKSTNRYVRSLLDEIFYVQDCEQDPAQGHYYGPARKAKVGKATATYFVDYNADGTSSGGGVAVIRDGNRFGFVSLMTGYGKPGSTLKKVALQAADNLR